MPWGRRFPAVITLIGTGHVFDLRKRLQREVLSRAPDVVCLELDPGRLHALLTKQQGGDAPLAYRMLAEFQGRIASDEGIAPGDEMLAAFEAARQAQVPVELIDVDARVAFGKLWSDMGWWEKARFLGSAAVGGVLPKWFVKRELDKLQREPSDLLAQLGKEYPTVRRVLIDERDAHMAARLAALRAGGKERIVAVVGDGHIAGMRQQLEQRGLAQETEVVRLRDLRSQEGASYSFTTEVDWRS